MRRSTFAAPALLSLALSLTAASCDHRSTQSGAARSMALDGDFPSNPYSPNCGFDAFLPQGCTMTPPPQKAPVAAQTACVLTRSVGTDRQSVCFSSDINVSAIPVAYHVVQLPGLWTETPVLKQATDVYCYGGFGNGGGEPCTSQVTAQPVAGHVTGCAPDSSSASGEDCTVDLTAPQINSSLVGGVAWIENHGSLGDCFVVGGIDNVLTVTKTSVVAGPFFCDANADMTGLFAPNPRTSEPMIGNGPNQCEGDPVDLATGEFFDQTGCFSVGSGGYPLDASVRWSSRTFGSGHTTAAIGAGWSTTFSRKVLYTPPPPPDCVSGVGGVTCEGVVFTLQLIDEMGTANVYELTGAPTSSDWTIPGAVWTFTPRSLAPANQQFGSLTMRRDAARDVMVYVLHYTNGDVDQFESPVALKGANTLEFGPYDTMAGRLVKATNRAGNSISLTLADEDSSDTPDCTAATCFKEVLTSSATGATIERLHRFLQVDDASQPGAKLTVLRLTQIREGLNLVPGQDRSRRRTVNLSYDGSGRLTALTKIDGHTIHYGYDAQGLISERCDENQDPAAANRKCLQTTYDGSWLVKQQLEPSGTVLDFTRKSEGGYDMTVTATSPAAPAQSRSTKYGYERYPRFGSGPAMIAPLLSVVSNSYATPLTSPLATSYYTHDPLFGWLLSATDQRSRRSEYCYYASCPWDPAAATGAPTNGSTESSTGNLTALGVDCGGAWGEKCNLTTHYTYNDYAQLMSTTTPDGIVTQNGYDPASGLLQSVQRTSPTHDVPAQTWLYGSDAHELLRSVTLPDGTVTRYDYDALGYPKSVSFDTDTRSDGATPLGLVSKTTYDWRGYLGEETDYRGVRTQYTRDAMGNLLQKVVPNPTGTGVRTDQFAYDNAGNLTSTIVGVGTSEARTTTFAPAPQGPSGQYLPVSIIDALHREVRFAYDPLLGKVSTITEVAMNNRQTQLAYRQSGGWLESLTRADGSVPLRLAYDETGAVTVRQNGRGGQEVISYGSTLPRIEQVTDGALGALQLDHTPGFTLPGAGAYASSAQRRTYYDYDAPTGRLAATRVFTGNYGSNSSDGTATTSTLQYDGLGRITHVNDADGDSQWLVYDVRNRLRQSRLIGADGSEHDVLSFDFDAADRPTQAVAHGGPDAERITRYDYLSSAEAALDPWSLKAVTNPRGYVTSYRHGPAGQVTAVQRASGELWQEGYNQFAELVSRTNADNVTVSYERDALGQVTTRTRGLAGNSLGATRQESWRYNADGTLSSYTAPSGTTSFTYDLAGRRTHTDYPSPPSGSAFVQAPAADFGYYDDDLLYATRTGSASGDTTMYDWNSDGQPYLRAQGLAAAPSLLRQVRHDYDTAQRPINIWSIMGASGSEGLVTYGQPTSGSSRIATLTPPGPTATTLPTAVSWTSEGLPAQLRRPEGVVSTWQTDRLSQLQRLTHTRRDANDALLGWLGGSAYDYDLDGNVIHAQRNANEDALSYDADNRLLADVGLAPLATTPGPTVPTSEALANGDFESGLGGGWYTWCGRAPCVIGTTTTNAHGGQTAVVLQNGTVPAGPSDGSGAYVMQAHRNVVHAGETYLVSAWARGATGNETVTVALQDQNAPWAWLWGRTCPAAIGWTECAATVSVPADWEGRAIKTVIGVTGADNQTIYVDDAMSGTLAVPPGQALYNGDFESGWLGWYTFSDGVTPSYALVGSADSGTAMQLGRASGRAAVLQPLPRPVHAGEQYILSASAKSDAASAQLQLTMDGNDAPYTLAGSSSCALTSSWSTCTVAITIPVTLDGQLVKVMLLDPSSSGGSPIVVDNVELDVRTLTTTFQYDGSDNLVHGDNGDFTYDPLREQISNPGFAYDSDGNLTADGVNRYVYDTADRLAQTVIVASGRKVNYSYDALGQLVRQVVLEGDGTIVSDLTFVLDEIGTTRVASVVLNGIDATNHQVDRGYEHYAWGPAGLFARQRITLPFGTDYTSTSTREYALSDGDGTVLGWIDASTNSVTQGKSFDVWGNVLSGVSSDRGFFGYHGEWHNPDGTIYLRNRIYSSRLHRFLQYDPLADTQTNAYTYADNNPATFSDPLGLSSCAKGGPVSVGGNPGYGRGIAAPPVAPGLPANLDDIPGALASKSNPSIGSRVKDWLGRGAAAGCLIVACGTDINPTGNTITPPGLSPPGISDVSPGFGRTPGEETDPEKREKEAEGAAKKPGQSSAFTPGAVTPASPLGAWRQPQPLSPTEQNRLDQYRVQHPEDPNPYLVPTPVGRVPVGVGTLNDIGRQSQPPTTVPAAGQPIAPVEPILLVP